MSAVGVLVRNGLRRHPAAHAGLALVIALGLGGAMTSLSIAWRTDHAYPDYLRRAEVGDVVVNPTLATDRVAQVISTAPGVVAAVSDSLILATPDDGAPRTGAEIEGNPTQFRSSTDGRYRDKDRPVVHRGRMVRGTGEAFLSLNAADELGLDVGDEFPIAFWQVTAGLGGDPSEIVDPIGRGRPGWSASVSSPTRYCPTSSIPGAGSFSPTTWWHRSTAGWSTRPPTTR